MKVALKELRETEMWLKIIVRTKLIQPSTKLSHLLQETGELISILFRHLIVPYGTIIGGYGEKEK